MKQTLWDFHWEKVGGGFWRQVMWMIVPPFCLLTFMVAVFSLLEWGCKE